MHDVMVGMFWGGVVMAVPPVAISVALGVYIYRQWRAAREDTAEETTVD